MQDLQQAIVSSFNAKVQSGEIDKQISDRLNKFTESVLSDVLASYGDFSKALKDKIQADLIAGIERFSLQSYNEIVVNKIKERVEQAYVTDATKHVEKLLDKLFRKPTIKKFSELFKMFIEDNDDEARDEQWEHASLHIDDRDHIVFIYFDPKPNTADYSCLWRLTMDREGHVLSAARRTSTYSKSFREEHEYQKISASLNRMDAFESTLFQLQSFATVLEKDFDRAESSTNYEWYKD